MKFKLAVGKRAKRCQRPQSERLLSSDTGEGQSSWRAGAERAVPVPFASCKRAALAPQLPERRPLLVTHGDGNASTPRGVQPSPRCCGPGTQRVKICHGTARFLKSSVFFRKARCTAWIKMTAGCSLLGDTARTTGNCTLISRLAHRRTGSQNPRIFGVGRDLCGSPSPAPCPSRVTQSRGHSTAARWGWNICREGDSTAPL